MPKRMVIEIDEEKCDGCGSCAGGCHEGALRIIDGKARLVGESLCDGLGACVGECPRGALRTVERDVQDYDERNVLENILPKGMATVAAHLDHLSRHGQDSWYAQALSILKEKGLKAPAPEPSVCGCESSPGPDNGMSGVCPGSAAKSFAVSEAATGLSNLAPDRPAAPDKSSSTAVVGGMASRLAQWPIQLHLINPRAPYFRNADLLVAADCTAFACGAFHPALLAGRRLIIACPKLDLGREIYLDKIRALIEDSSVGSITVAIMDIPCCGGLKRLVDDAAASASRSVPIATVVVSAEGGSLTWM